MDELSLNYLDYHRTIIGFHGTDARTADRLVDGEPFQPSKDVDEWLGEGVYFWEYGPKLAWWWVDRNHKIKDKAVVGAMIRLGNCFDLLDSENVTVLRTAHAGMIKRMKAAKVEVPKNYKHHKRV